jgi:predicted O-methyltransferase YrrM
MAYVTVKIENRTELARLFNTLGFKTGVEIGVACGKYSQRLCTEIPGLKIYCVDPWKQYPENKRSGSQERLDGHYGEAVERLKPYNTVIIREMSMDAVKHFDDNSLDFVFIDGNHNYSYVLDDITEWSKKIRSGGIVSGHDYYKFRRSGVIEAVTEYLKDKPDITLNTTTTHRPPGEARCFWWVKP